jgi:lipopolysaccharide biosynthesis protein
MEQIIIRIKDKQKAQTLMDFLRTLDFVVSIASADLPAKGKEQSARDADFFALAGLWSGRDVTLRSLRERAWPYRV